MKRSAMTLTELIVGVAILTLLAGVTHLSPDLYKHTAKREAERVYAKLSQCMLEADRTHISFILEVESGRLKIIWQKPNIMKSKATEYFDAKPGCLYSWNAPHDELLYSHVLNRYTQGTTIIITGKGEPHKIIIATIGSRIRLSS